ncbi:hypothetical protein FJY93_03470 [Candidatus Kaiserbacteria bacterium]|nr:hypothetical protein [Candidatus Kaiserbacteria bacterium]
MMRILNVIIITRRINTSLSQVYACGSNYNNLEILYNPMAAKKKAKKKATKKVAKKKATKKRR